MNSYFERFLVPADFLWSRCLTFWRREKLLEMTHLIFEEVMWPLTIFHHLQHLPGTFDLVVLVRLWRVRVLCVSYQQVCSVIPLTITGCRFPVYLNTFLILPPVSWWEQSVCVMSRENSFRGRCEKVWKQAGVTLSSRIRKVCFNIRYDLSSQLN